MEEEKKPCSDNKVDTSKTNVDKKGGKPIKRRQDWQWYANSEGAAKDMASFPFLDVIGDNFIGSDKAPAALVITLKHAVGSSQNLSNYKTRSAQAYYQYLTQGYTGGVDFEAPDIFLASIAAASLAAMFMAGKRAYGMLRYNLQLNAYYPDAMIAACGFDATDLRKNAANFRTEFNLRVKQFNDTIAVPEGFAIAKRWAYIESSVFTDQNMPEYASIMVYLTSHYLQYDPTTAKTGTSLKWLDAGVGSGKKISMEHYFQNIDTLMNALTDDDVKSMFGSLRRVYQPSEFITLSEIDEEYLTPVVRNDAVAAAIHNMVWTNKSATDIIGLLPANLATGNMPSLITPVYQDATGVIHSTIGYGTQDTPQQGYQSREVATSEVFILDMYDHQSDPYTVLDMTVNLQVYTNTLIYQVGDPTPGYYYLLNCRCEVVYNVCLLTATGTNVQAVVTNINKTIKRSEWASDAVLKAVSLVSHIDSHPVLFFVSEGSSGYGIEYLLGELDKYTTINSAKIAQLQDRCLFQLMGLPKNTKSVT